jgi:hypothetical protein
VTCLVDTCPTPNCTHAFHEPDQRADSRLTAVSAPILSLPLQAGRYLIIGKVWVSGSQSNFTAICTTGVGPTGDAGVAAAYNGTAGVAVSDTITMQVVELSAAGTATISCSTPRAASWGEATLSAIQVG